jgi:hypothetical protein
MGEQSRLSTWPDVNVSRANAALFSGETKHTILMIILENIPNLILYTPAPDANRCDQSDKVDARYVIHRNYGG